MSGLESRIPPGSVLELVERGEVKDLVAPTAGGRLTLLRLRCRSRNRGDAEIVADFLDERSGNRSESEVRVRWTGIEVGPAANDWALRGQQRFQDEVRERAADPHLTDGLGEAVLYALLAPVPTGERTIASLWVSSVLPRLTDIETRGRCSARPEATRVAASATRELWLTPTGPEVILARGASQLLTLIELGVEPKVDVEATLAVAIDIRDYFTPAPDPASIEAALAQIDRYREALAASLSDPAVLLAYPFSFPSPWTFFRFALEEGPPPETLPIRGTLGPTAAKSSVLLERATTDGLESLDLPGGNLVRAYRIGRFRIVLCLDLGVGGSREDIVYLQADGGAPVPILVGDPWNPPVAATVDGDEPTWRTFATWLGDALERRGMNEPYTDERGSRPRECRLSDWLRFAEAEIHRPKVPILDLRIQAGMVADFAYDGLVTDPALGLEGQRQAAALYHGFLREVIDPGFIPAR